MKQLKRYSILGALLVLVTGTLAHFFYEWSGNNFIIGFFTPVNESTWEHMKLIFFPMLLSSCFLIKKLQTSCPCISFALAPGILAGTFAVPVLFYTYTGILGYDVFVLDIITFALSVILAFYVVYKCALRFCAPDCAMEENHLPHRLFCGLVCLLAVCFLLFTYHPPNIGLFADPFSASTQ